MKRKRFSVTYQFAGMAYTLSETFAKRRQAVKVAFGLVSAGFPSSVRRIK